MKNKEKQTENSKKSVIAFRKACKASGVGLSHYILMDQRVKNEKK